MLRDLMKFALVMLVCLVTITGACKKEHTNTQPPPPPPPPEAEVKEYAIDFNFTISPDCSISSDTTDDPYFWNYYYELSAIAPGKIDNKPVTLSGQILQAKGFSISQPYIPVLTVSEGNPHDNVFYLAIDSVDLFQLNYNNDIANFSTTCYVTDGSGRYANIKPGPADRLLIVGTADTTHHSGSFRITGKIFF